MALFLVWITSRKLIGAFRQWDAGYCQWINELAVALGLLGTIRGFIVVASEQSSYTTGTDIIVDGGYLSHSVVS